MRDLVLRNSYNLLLDCVLKIPEPLNHLERTYMRKFIVTLMASLLSCSAASAFWPEATDSSLEVGVGYRQDRLEWKTKSRFDSSSSSDSSYDREYGMPQRLRSELKWR